MNPIPGRAALLRCLGRSEWTARQCSPTGFMGNDNLQFLDANRCHEPGRRAGFPACWFSGLSVWCSDGRLESRPNRQTGMFALQRRFMGSEAQRAGGCGAFFPAPPPAALP